MLTRIVCCVLVIGAVAVVSAQAPRPAPPLRVWVFTKPDPTTMHYDEWRLRDNAVIYTKRLLTPQTVMGGYREEARRPLALEPATTADDAHIVMEVVSVDRVNAADGSATSLLQLTMQVTAEGLKPAELKGQSTVTHGAVLDMLKQFDKWLKDNAVDLQRIERRQKPRSDGGGPS